MNILRLQSLHQANNKIKSDNILPQCSIKNYWRIYVGEKSFKKKEFASYSSNSFMPFCTLMIYKQFLFHFEL